jgi:hypothetical protein
MMKGVRGERVNGSIKFGHEKAAIVGVILTGTVAVGGRIMKITREQLFAAPKIARRAEDRLERGP